MAPTTHRRTRRVIAAGAFVVVGAICLPAQAAISPASPEPGPPSITSRPATLPAGTSSMYQTNDAVWSLALVDNTLFAGGDFTNLRAPGAAQGTELGGTEKRVRLAAFDKNTGVPIPGFSHSLDARVTSIAVSPDKSTLYVRGLFSVVDGKAHSKIAAFDLTQAGTPVKDWAPNVASGQVRALAVDGNNFVYVGGQFSSIGGQSRSNVAKIAGATGVVQSWNAVVDGPVNALGLYPGHVWMGGNFNAVNGAPRRALAHVDTGSANGKTTFSNAAVIPASTSTTRSDVKTIVVNGSTVYIGAEGTGGGVYDGTAALNATSGAQVWRNACLGATQTLAVIGGVVYDGSHAHDCSAVGAFGQQGA